MKFKLLRLIIMISIFTLCSLSIQCLLVTTSFASIGNTQNIESFKNEVDIQGITITGKVTSEENNEGLPGVNVIVEGTNQGTVTDIEGNYKIDVPDVNSILVFSSVGFVSDKVTVGGQTIIDMVLVPDLKALHEIVVVGYGTQRKSDITGSLTSVNIKEIQEIPALSTDAVLQGRVPGVWVQNNSGSPRPEYNIRIRGANSIQGGNNPLIVIDGFQGGDLSILNPQDIESIEILKDASATAIYGSRGANGVVLVTTKMGKSGKPQISYNGFFGMSQLSKKIDLLDAGQFAETVNAQRIETGHSPYFSSAEIADFKANGGTDWQDEVFRNAFSHNHQLSVRGANDYISYYLAGNYADQEGIMKGTSYNKYSFRGNLNFKISKRLKLNINSYMAREYEQTNKAPDQRAVYSSLLFAPTKPVYDEDGNYTLPEGGVGPPTNFNPLGLAVEPIGDNYYNTSNLNANFEWEIIDGLKLMVQGSYRLYDTEQSIYVNGKVTHTTGNETASITDGKSITLQNTNQISYEKQTNSGHFFKITGVLEQQQKDDNWNFAGSNGFLTDAFTYNNLGSGFIPKIPESGKSSRSLLSYMGRFNYGYKDRYLLTLTGRSDGSSVFGENNKRGFFPSVAIGWNISNENFMINSATIDNLKLRASYGIVGNQAIAPYQSIAKLITDTYAINAVSPSIGVSQSTQAANPDLKWEKTIQMDIGIDLDLLEGRINFVADYYRKRTEDLLLGVGLPNTSGTLGILRNIGEVENKGIELYLGGRPFVGNFSWETGFNITKNDNKVIALADGVSEIRVGSQPPGHGSAMWLEVGQPIGQVRAYVQDGVWGTDEAAEAAEYGFIPGAPKYIDQNNDGAITAADIAPIGNTQPDLFWGWNNTFRYKNIDLSVFIHGVSGNDIYFAAIERVSKSNNDADATSVVILDRWTPENQDTDVPSFTGTLNYEYIQSSRWLQNGSFIRLKNIILGYNFPASLLDAISIKSARIYVSGTNLLTITDFTGYDPELSDKADISGGFQYDSYPTAKTFTIGLNIGF